MDTENFDEKNQVLKMTGIRKSFPGVRALNQVDFTLRRGEIHAIMGENGAGKSTLIKVLTGVYSMDDGNISLLGKNIRINSTKDAQKHGISTVYQEVNLCPNLTVGENLFLGYEPRTAGFIDWRKMYANATELLQKLNIPVSPIVQLDTCSIAVQQLIAIARAVSIDCKVLILDEPTSSLDKDAVQKLFTLMKQLREDGVGIIFITHFIEQVYEVCDRITVLRNGELIGEYLIENLSRLQLVTKMLGKELEDLSNLKTEADEKKHDTETPLLEAVDYSSGVSRVAPFDFKINKGEVVGFSGLLGSGRSELVRSLYGADEPIQGNISINGEEVTIKKPLDAMKERMAYLPEDRKADGIFPDLSVRENMIIALQTKHGVFNRSVRKEMNKFADEYIRMFNIKTASQETPIKSLSGGNQQKVILARWLITSPDLIILDEPTRGIDVGTKTEIQKLILKLSWQGKSIAFISSELDEMLRTCSRMVVMRDRRKVKELTGTDLNHDTIMRTIAGGGNDSN